MRAGSPVGSPDSPAGTQGPTCYGEKNSRADAEPDLSDPLCREFRFTPARITAACRLVAEGKRFRKACLESAEPWGSLFLFKHETGLRKRALLGLQWSHVLADRKQGRFSASGAAIVIPSDNMKTGRSDHRVDLRPEALEALDRRWAARRYQDRRCGRIRFCVGRRVAADELAI